MYRTTLLYATICALFSIQSITSKSSDPHVMFDVEESPDTADDNTNNRYSFRESQNLTTESLNNTRFSLLHKQLVVSFWRRLSECMTVNEDHMDLYLYATLHFDPKMLLILQRYLNSSDNAEEVNNVFMRMFVNLTVENPHYNSKSITLTNETTSIFESLFRSDVLFYPFSIIAIYIGYLVLLAVSRRFRSVVSWRILLVFIFFMSVLMNWIRLYKEAVADRHNFIQTELARHRDCSNIADINWYQSLKLWFNQQFFIKKPDPCSEAVKKLLVDPFWDVTPLDAVSETVSKFILYPCAKIGESTGILFQKMNQYLPLWMIPFVCVFLLLMLIVLLSVFRGYSLRIPFLLHFEAPKMQQPIPITFPYQGPPSPRGQLPLLSHADRHCKKYIKACRWKQQVLKHNRLHEDEANE